MCAGSGEGEGERGNYLIYGNRTLDDSRIMNSYFNGENIDMHLLA